MPDPSQPTGTGRISPILMLLLLVCGAMIALVAYVIVFVPR
jgi:hypothetical protein